MMPSLMSLPQCGEHYDLHTGQKRRHLPPGRLRHLRVGGRGAGQATGDGAGREADQVPGRHLGPSGAWEEREERRWRG